MPEQRVGSPEWWRGRLVKKLNARQKIIKRYNDYYEGEHQLAFATEKFLQAFGGLFKEFSDNFCSVVVDASAERLKVRGFRVPNSRSGPAGKLNPSQGDKDAWRMWQANQLDARSVIAHFEAHITGEASVIVWNNPKDEKTPLITVEHASQVILEDAPDGTGRAAALKLWRDDWTEKLFATLYLPDGIFKWESDRRRLSVASGTGWAERVVSGETWPLPNPLEVVPVVTLRNRPRLLRYDSEIRDVIPVQDAINMLLANMMVASEHAAMRRKWATGMEIPVDPETNQPVEPFEKAVGRLWISEDATTKFGEFSETPLENFVKPVEMFVQHLATRTRTPPHYFYAPGAQPPAGVAIKGAETGLVAKVGLKQLGWGEDWEEVIRLGFGVIGDKRFKVTSSETIWGDPESRTEGEHVDATLKKQSLGVPWEQLMEDLDYSPEQIDRMRQMREQAATPPVPPTPPAPANAGAGG